MSWVYGSSIFSFSLEGRCLHSSLFEFTRRSHQRQKDQTKVLFDKWSTNGDQNNTHHYLVGGFNPQPTNRPTDRPTDQPKYFSQLGTSIKRILTIYFLKTLTSNPILIREPQENQAFDVSKYEVTQHAPIDLEKKNRGGPLSDSILGLSAYIALTHIHQSSSRILRGPAIMARPTQEMKKRLWEVFLVEMANHVIWTWPDPHGIFTVSPRKNSGW